MPWTEARRLQSLQLSLIRQVMESAPAKAINMALGEFAFPMPPVLKEKAIELLNSGNPAYTPNAGLPELRQIIAERYSALPQNVVVTNGAEEALFIAIMGLINPGDTLAIPDPDYPAYPALATIFEAKVLRLPFADGFSTPDWDNWEQAMQSGLKAIILSSPSNPNGFYFDDSSALKFSELCNRYGITVIVDEIYDRLYFTEPPVSLNGKVERLIRIGGLSKSHALSGWRLGWLIAPSPLAAAFTKAKQYVSTCSHWLSQKLAIYALSDAGILLVGDIRSQLLANRSLLLMRFQAGLPKGVISIHAPLATPYVLLEVNDDLQYARELAARGVITVPGRAFGSSTVNWVRLNYGIAPQDLEVALDIIYA